MKALYWLVFTLAVAVPSFGQQVIDPTRLLGITYEQLRQSHPNDCKKLRPGVFENEKKISLESCEVKNSSKELVPGSEIIKEVVFFKDRTIIQLDFFLKERQSATSGLNEIYGSPDPPTETGHDYQVSEDQESHANYRYWTRPHFQIRLEYFTVTIKHYRPTLPPSPYISETVSFVLRSEEPTIAEQTAPIGAMKQGSTVISNEAKASPDAAGLPSSGRQVKDPTTLLGTTYEQFRQWNPNDCKKLKATISPNKKKNVSVQWCEVKGDSKELVPGSKISNEVVFFKDHTIIQLDFSLDYRNARAAESMLKVIYGPPDLPAEVHHDYPFTREGQGGVTYSFWTRPAYQIRWQVFTYITEDRRTVDYGYPDEKVSFASGRVSDFQTHFPGGYTH